MGSSFSEERSTHFLGSMIQGEELIEVQIQMAEQVQVTRTQLPITFPGEDTGSRIEEIHDPTDQYGGGGGPTTAADQP